MPTPSTQSGGALASQHVRWSAARYRLMNASPPVPRPERERPVSPFVREIIEKRRAEEESARLRRLFTAPIVEIDDNGTDVIEPRQNMPSWKFIALQVAAKHRVSLADLCSPRRAQEIVRARHEAFYRCAKETTMSLPQIGRRFGDRDHTTVLHGVRAHERRIQEALVGK